MCDSWSAGLSVGFADMQIGNATISGMSTDLQLPPPLIKPLVEQSVSFALPVCRSSAVDCGGLDVLISSGICVADDQRPPEDPRVPFSGQRSMACSPCTESCTSLIHVHFLVSP